MAGLLIVAPRARATEAQVDPVAFTLELCRRGAAVYADPGSNPGESAPPPLSPRLLELNQEFVQSPRPLDGPIIHVLFGPGLLPRTPVEIGSAHLLVRSAGTAIVAVDMVIKGRPQSTRFFLIADQSSWLVDNVDYGGTDYVSWMNDLIRRSQ